MNDIKLIGKEVELTKGEVKVELVDVVEFYKQDIQDIKNINREIVEYQARIDDALARKAHREGRIAVVETKALQVIEERKSTKKDPIKVEPVIKEIIK